MKTCAKWVAANKEFETPIIRKEFNLNNFDGGLIRICGLGFFELWINGVRVDENYFKPAWTNYNYRDFTNLLYPISNNFGYRRYYLEYDIGNLLKQGKNVLTVLLGNGWYRQNKRKIEGNLWYDERLKLWFDLEYFSNEKECHVVSDKSLLHAQSHIVFSNIYFGETHDYSNYEDVSVIESKRSDFVPMEEVEECGFVFEKQPCSADAVVRTIAPIEVSKTGNVRVFDARENITGWAVIRGARSNVKISYAEELYKDGSLDFLGTGGVEQISCDEYLSPSYNMTLRPMFHWNAFRYFSVEGDFESVVCEVVHQNVPVLSSFECSDSNLNWLYDTFIRTQLNNYHCGVPSDCPHRERLGYTGDGWLTAQCAMSFLGVREFYKKWLIDIFDCQDPISGHVRHTAPFYGGGGGPGGWGGAIVYTSYFYYEAYRDKDFLQKAFPYIKKYLTCMESFSKDGRIVKEIDGGWCLGDWCVPEELKIPNEFVNTVFYIIAMKMTDEIAEVLGEKPFNTEKIAYCTNALISTYYNEKEKTFCGGVQGADIFAAELGLDGLISFDKIAERYAQSRTFDTGIFGTYFLIKQLVKHNRADVAFDLLTSEKYPSFGFMKNNGATTFWESWDGGMSHDHPMFGGCIYYLMQACLGVKCENFASPRIVIKPLLCDRLDWAKGSIYTPFGMVSVSFSTENEKKFITVLLPENTQADLIIDKNNRILTESYNKIQID